MTRKDVVTKIGQIRYKKGISGYELSLRIDKSQNYMYEVEKGKTNISLDMLLAICRELEIHPRELFD